MDVKLTVLLRGRKGKVLELRGPEAIIGRSPEAQVKIPSALVSRQHCRLTVKDSYLIAEELNSANGTYVNGMPIAKQVVRPGDQLQVGPIIFQVDYELSGTGERRLLSEVSTAFEIALDQASDDEIAGAADMTIRREARRGPIKPAE